MLRRLIPVLALGTLAGLTGCADDLPLEPDDLATGIVVYEHANFRGESAHITEDISDLRNFRGPCRHVDSDGRSDFDWNDCISSVRVAPGWRATLYRDDDYRDDSIELTSDHSNLQLVNHDCPKDGLNDCVTSVRVRRQ